MQALAITWASANKSPAIGGYRFLPIKGHTGNAKQLDCYLGLGLHIGITGWICDDRRGKHLRGIINRIPVNRLMIKTDAPFLIPPDLRHNHGNRNEPSFLPHVLAEVASAVGRSAQEVADSTNATATALFGLNK